MSEIDRDNAVVIARNQQNFNYTASADGIVVAVNNGNAGGLTTKLNGVTLAGYADTQYGSGGVRMIAVVVKAGDSLSFASTSNGWNWGAVFYPYK